MRSGFTARMKFQRDSDTTTLIRWYRVPLTRPVLDLPTPFRSSIWDDDALPVHLGEEADTRQWWNGGPAPLVPVGVPGRCGNPDQWLNGVSATDPQPALDLNTGAPVCCGPVALIGLGGIAEGPPANNVALPEADALLANVCHGAHEILGEADGMVAQVCWHAWEELPEAEYLGAVVVPPAALAELPEAEYLGAVVVPPAALAELPEAEDLGAVVVPPAALAELPEADYLAALVAPPAFLAELPEAEDLAALVAPPPPLPELPDAEGLTAVVTSGGGGVSPGLTCASAGTITLPFNQTQPITAGTVHWWKFAGVAGIRYHLRLTLNSGNLGSGTLGTGSCPSPTPNVLFGSPFPNCGSFLLASSGTVFVEVTAHATINGNYTIEVATGLC